MLLGKPQWFVGAIQDALQRGRVELRGKRGVLERLGYHIPRRAVPLQFDHDHIPLAVDTKQVDRLAEVGWDLAPDDQKRTVFENPARVGLQPPLKDGFPMVGLERHRFVFSKLAVRFDAEDSHGWLASYPRTAESR